MDNDLNSYSRLCKAVKKVKQESALHFDRVPMRGDSNMFIFIHDKTISFSDVDKTKLWQSYLFKIEYTTEEINEN